jgi:hypothetical protein
MSAMSQELTTELLNRDLENLGLESQRLADYKDNALVMQDTIFELEKRQEELRNAFEAAECKNEKRIFDLENELTENLLRAEDREAELRHMWKEDQDLFARQNLGDSNGFKISEDQNDGSAILKQNHQRIVCDTCLDVHIYGSRFKSFGENFNDICEKCYPQSCHQDPVLEWKAPCGITPEKLEDLMPYFKILLAEVQNGRCKVHANQGFGK